MCPVCKRYRCASSCPNAPEPNSSGRCAKCKDHIVDGEEMVEIEGKSYHFECLSSRDILELLDIPIEEAGDD